MKTTLIARKFSSLVAAALLAAVTVTSGPAHAASVTGVPSQVEWGGDFLLVQYSDVNHRAQVVSPGCGIPANSMDSLKIWQSMTQAAVLAGKNVDIYYDTCNGQRYIRDIVLKG